MNVHELISLFEQTAVVRLEMFSILEIKCEREKRDSIAESFKAFSCGFPFNIFI